MGLKLAALHTSCQSVIARSHSPSKTGVNALMATKQSRLRRRLDCFASLTMTGSLRRLLLRGDQLAVDQAFGDLDGVERRALAQIVGDDPHREPVLDRRVLADAADIGRILAPRLVGRHVAARLARIDDETAWRVTQDVARLVG